MGCFPIPTSMTRAEKIMPISDDNLREALRKHADQARPASFTPGPIVRRVARLRAQFTAIAVCCALATGAAAVAVPIAVRAPAHPSQSVAPVVQQGRPWDTAFTCGQALASTLPGSATDELDMAIGPVTRTASGVPTVTWFLKGTGINNSAPALGPVTAAVLFVRDRTVIAVQQAGQPVIRATIPLIGVLVPANEVHRYQPKSTTCAPGSWNTLWAHRQDYRVVIVATVWTETYTSVNPRFLSAAATLTQGR